MKKRKCFFSKCQKDGIHPQEKHTNMYLCNEHNEEIKRLIKKRQEKLKQLNKRSVK